MEQKRKIVIPLGGSSREATATPSPNYDGGMTVPAPLFDEEATLGAQPVVPLAAASSAGTTSRLPLIALLVVLAVSAGVVGGFAIGVYRSRQNKQAATAATTTTASSGATAQPSSQLPVIASEKSPEPPARTTAAADTEAT